MSLSLFLSIILILTLAPVPFLFLLCWADAIDRQRLKEMDELENET